MLVTALEANKDVPQMEVVTECLLHEERKLNDRGNSSGTNRAMAAYRHKRNIVICHYCEKPGHIKHNCRKLAADEKKLILGANTKVIQSLRLRLTKPLHISWIQVVIAMPW